MLGFRVSVTRRCGVIRSHRCSSMLRRPTTILTPTCEKSIKTRVIFLGGGQIDTNLVLLSSSSRRTFLDPRSVDSIGHLVFGTACQRSHRSFIKRWKESVNDTPQRRMTTRAVPRVVMRRYTLWRELTGANRQPLFLPPRLRVLRGLRRPRILLLRPLAVGELSARLRQACPLRCRVFFFIGLEPHPSGRPVVGRENGHYGGRMPRRSSQAFRSTGESPSVGATMLGRPTHSEIVRSENV